jgi:hypothetical protein
MYINNDYFINKLPTFVFQNISIVIHCNSILNEILFLILHLQNNMKMAETGATFPSTPGAQRVLETLLLTLMLEPNISTPLLS